MKRCFRRVAAICLVAVLVLGLLPSGSAYANDDSAGTAAKIEQTDPEVSTDNGTSSSVESPSDILQEAITDAQENDAEDSSDTDTGEDSTKDSTAGEQEDESTDSSTNDSLQVTPSEDLGKSQASGQDTELETLESNDGTLTIKNTVTDATGEISSNYFTFEIIVWDVNKPYNSSMWRKWHGDVYLDITSLYDALAVSDTDDTIVLPAGYLGINYVEIPANSSVTLTGLPDSYGYYIRRMVQQKIDSYDANYYLKTLTGTTGTTEYLYSHAYAAQTSGDNEVEYTFGYADQYLRLGTEIAHSIDPDSYNKEFTFTIYLYKHDETTNTNSALFDEDTKEIEISAEGSDGVAAPNLGSTIQFTKETTDLKGIENKGTYNVATVTLKPGQSVFFKNLKENYGYYIIEKPDIHYLVSSYSNQNFWIGDEEHDHDNMYDSTVSYDWGYSYRDQISDTCKVSSSVDFIYAQTTVSITKKVVGNNTDRDFVFNVFFVQYSPDDATYSPLAEGDYKLTYTGRTEDAPETVHIQPLSRTGQSDITHDKYKFIDTDGTVAYTEWSVAQIKLAAGQSVMIEGLSDGIIYDIQEVPVSSYKTTITDVVNGTIREVKSEDGDDNSTYSTVYSFLKRKDASATFVNTYIGKNLTITETVTGNLGDQNQKFPCSITLTDQDGNPLSGTEFMVTMPDQTEQIYTTDANGTITIKLKHGEQITIQDLPQHSKYSVTEYEADNYTTSFGVNGGSADEQNGWTQSGSIDTDDVVVDVKNDLNGAIQSAFTIQKLVNGSSDFEKADGTKFAFTLKQTGGSTCYIGPSPYQAFKDSVITINGTGTALSDELYFFKSGEYTFTLTENDLTGSEAEGYTKDQTQYDITIEVVAEGDALKVTKATYVKHGEDDAKELTNAVLTFDNKYDTVEEVMATPVSTKKSKTGAVKTGDQTQIGLYGTLFGVSALVLALAEKERRRRRR